MGYPPMGPPPRMMPRMHPSYYDYDYPGYGGGYYYMPPPPPPRMSRYDSYLDDEVESPYLPRNYRPRVVDIDDTELKDKRVPHVTTSTSTTTPRISSYTPSTRDYSPGMLQDHVDKMRIRLKSLAYSLDPTGPVPEIILPERTKKSGASASGHDDKKYQSVMELNELPRLASRRQRYYPEDDHTKENLRIKCLSHYKTTRTQAESQMRDLLPDSSSRLSKYSSSSKWEEPDTVFGGPSDRKPYSKVETGSSFFSTYGYTHRKKDYVAEEVRDYYYFGRDSGGKEQPALEQKKEEVKEQPKQEKEQQPEPEEKPQEEKK